MNIENIDLVKLLLVSLAPKRDLNEILGTSLELLRKQCGLDSAAVFLYNSSYDYLKLESQFGLSAKFINKLIGGNLRDLKIMEFSPIPPNEEVFIQDNLDINLILRENSRGERRYCKLIILTLKLEGLTKGYLWLIKKNPCDISTAETETLKEVGKTLSVLIDKAQVYKEMYKTVEQLERLINVQNSLLIDLDENSILKRAMNEILYIFNPDIAEIIIFKEDWIEVYNKDGKNNRSEKDTGMYLSHQKMKSYLEEKKDFIIYDNVINNPARFPYTGDYKIISCIILPVIIEKRIEGFFIIGKNEPLFFRREDIPLYAAFPLIISQALYIGKLHQNILKLQDQLFQAAKMESIGVLASGISHDFNNALAGLIGAADLIEMAVKEDPKLSKFVNIIQKSSLRMANWTKQLLAYAKGGFFILKTLNLNQSIIESLNMVQNGFNKKISLIISLSRDLKFIEADTDGMKQTITNILLNAGEAITDKGEIKISTENVPKESALYDERNLDKEKEYIKISINDNGCGIEDKVAEKIFDPFFTTKFTGRGLGLSAVYGIIQRHKGKIFIESELNFGTSIEIFLPVKEDLEENMNLQKAPRQLGTHFRLKQSLASLEAPRKLGTRSIYKESRAFLEESVPKKSIIIVSIFDVEEPPDYKILACDGYFVIECHDIESALSILEESENKDLIFIDSQYIELAVEKIIPALNNIKSEFKVMISLGEDRQKIDAETLKDIRPVYIHRPFSQMELLSYVKDILAG